MQSYSHVVRFAILLFIVILAFFAVRSFLIPPSFGISGSYTYGYHRAGSDNEQAILYARFQGSEKCRKCHAEQYQNWAGGGHVTIACETCHGSWQAHNNNTKDQVVKDRSIEACMLCHQQLAARPFEFPQVADIEKHAAEQKEELKPGMVCVDCHNAHVPL